ncbi:MAG TPA: endonuclease [Myxococcota bacterium]|nr:endonuclease [Myxococcota bacterium]HOS61422.1 endonuclease [Myxococcota bacterium]HPL24392.1 endonuclease [Myxococcota bacterium]
MRKLSLFVLLPFLACGGATVEPKTRFDIPLFDVAAGDETLDAQTDFGRDVLDDDGDHVSPDGCISDAVDAFTDDGFVDDGFADLTFDDGFVDRDDAAYDIDPDTDPDANDLDIQDNDGQPDVTPDPIEYEDEITEDADIKDDGTTQEDPGTGGDPLHIRFVAANLTSGRYQSYTPGHGIRLMAGCVGDIYLVQEFNYENNSASDFRKMTNDVCGAECDYSVGNGQIPNGVISRWPIVEFGYWDDPNISNRDLDWARIDIPGPKDLFAISVHLHTSPASDQVTAAQVVVKKVAEHRAANPGCCWYVVGGDFNGTFAVSDNGFGKWQGEKVFDVSDPHPVGYDGRYGTNASRSKQYDFVLLDTYLKEYQVPVVFGASGLPDLIFENGLVFDSRDFTQSQLDNYFSPALVGDSGASNMQHMGVVKDVSIPQ